MEMNFINKHKFGIVALLFFILLVSQEKSLHFLIHTILGRLSLIFLLLAISCFNITLGIIAVLYIIVLINKDNSFYLEAFDPEISKTKEEDSLKKIQDELKADKYHKETIVSSSLSASNAPTEMGLGREGFNTTERERNMQLGKKSNEIPPVKQSTENVEPFDNQMFSSTPSQFQ
jgi:hypothetical protein